MEKITLKVDSEGILSIPKNIPTGIYELTLVHTSKLKELTSISSGYQRLALLLLIRAGYTDLKEFNGKSDTDIMEIPNIGLETCIITIKLCKDHNIPITITDENVAKKVAELECI